MKIVAIELNNFIPFKGENHVEFSDGLNLINGSIGGGKSSFFNAFYWCLFNRIYITDEGWVSNPDKTEIINAITLNQLKVNETANCKVSLTIEVIENHEEFPIKTIYDVVRSFDLKKNKDSISIDRSIFELKYDDPDQGGTQFKADDLAEAIIENFIFPKVLSDYVWFQGESLDKLIDLDKSSSFKKVIDSISYLNYYEIIKEILEKTEKKLEYSKNKKITKSSTDKKKIDTLNYDLKKAKSEITSEEDFQQMDNQKDEFNKKIAELRNKLTSKSEVDSLLNQRDSNEQDIKEINRQIAILDELYKKQFVEGWMIKGLEPLINDAEKKIVDFELWMTKEINKESQLPDDVPGDKYLDYMIHEEKCMICGRDAKAGTEEHNHIKSLKGRRTKSEVLKPEIQSLNNNIQRIKGFTNQLLVKHGKIHSEIKDWTEKESRLNEKKNVLFHQKSQINNKIKEFEKKLGERIDNKSVGIAKVLDTMHTYKDKVSRLDYDIESKRGINAIKKIEIEKLKKQLSKIISDEGIEIKEEDQLERVINLKKALEITTKKEYTSLINDIQNRANKYIDEILLHNDSIKAKVYIDPEKNEISIIDNNNESLEMLNTGHKTIIKMSVINAIISKSSEYKEEPFPFITDAPTSSLGPKDTEAYLRLISNVFEQSIVLSKDFEELGDFNSKKIKIGTIFNLTPENLDNSKESSLTNTYTTITKLE